MLGTKYNIEPFYFSSSLGWIPSRYQSNAVSGVGDRSCFSLLSAPSTYLTWRRLDITITLTFARTMRNPSTVWPGPNWSMRPTSIANRLTHEPPNMMIDTHAPLPLWSNDVLLVPDILALHMVRSGKGNAIISYHPGYDHRTTTAEALHHRFALIGRSVYWNSMFKETHDPTLFLLSLMWYPLYCWDEAFENLFSHICFLVSLAIFHNHSQLTGSQESKALSANDMDVTHELHTIRAHLLHYQALLDDFRKTIMFIEQTPFPGLNDLARYPRHTTEISQQLLKTESANLLREIQRLQHSTQLQDGRLKKAMDHVCPFFLFL